MRMNRLHIMIGLCVGLFLYQTSAANPAGAEWARIGNTDRSNHDEVYSDSMASAAFRPENRAPSSVPLSR